MDVGEQGRRDPGFSHPPRLLPWPLGSASPETFVCLFLSFSGRQLCGFLTLSRLDFFPS